MAMKFDMCRWGAFLITTSAENVRISQLILFRLIYSGAYYGMVSLNFSAKNTHDQ